MMMRSMLMVTGAALAANVLAADGAFSWRMPEEKRGVELTECGLGIPETAVPDANTFTLEAKIRFESDPEGGAVAPIFFHESGEAGFALWVVRYNNARNGNSAVWLRCNGSAWEVARNMHSAGDEMTYTLSVKNGSLSVYRDGKLLRRMVVTPVPLIDPIRIGVRPDAKKIWKGVRLLEATARPEPYWGVGEDRKSTVGFIGGKGWLVSVPADESKPLPHLLYIGDSISIGYDKYLPKLLEGKGYGHHWVHFDGSGDKPVAKAYNVIRAPYLAACTARKYDVIVYNNGLHSLGWQEGYVDEKSVLDHYRSAIDVMREAAPQAKVVFLNTTPVFMRKATGEMELDERDGRNKTVRYLNRLAGRVMKEKGVDVIDVYSELENRNDLIGGDGVHWKPAGCALIAQRVYEKFMSLVGK